MFRQYVVWTVLLLRWTVDAAFLLGYTAESCDDLRPQRLPFVQDVTGQSGQQAFRPQPFRPQANIPASLNNQIRPNPNSPSGFGPNTPIGPNFNIPGPDGLSIRPILMQTLSPYRIITGDTRYKRGRPMEGKSQRPAIGGSFTAFETVCRHNPSTGTNGKSRLRELSMLSNLAAGQ